MVYTNEALTDLVKRINAKNRIVEYNSSFLQVIDPIFLNPSVNTSAMNYRTHFYAP